MTLSEFKAWFEGYTEGFEGAPSVAQFERIKEKLRSTGVAATNLPPSYQFGGSLSGVGQSLGFGNHQRAEN